ncbi:hypothetical protein GW916_03110 [bacterium]|nr:hypothetical protein [bacterium]
MGKIYGLILLASFAFQAQANIWGFSCTSSDRTRANQTEIYVSLNFLKDKAAISSLGKIEALTFSDSTKNGLISFTSDSFLAVGFLEGDFALFDKSTGSGEHPQMIDTLKCQGTTETFPDWGN